MRPRHLFFRRALFLAAALLCLGASSSRADDDDTIKKEDFLKHATEQFDRMAALFPDYAQQIEKTRKYFMERSDKAFADKPMFDPWEDRYVRRSLATTLHGLKAQIDITRRAALEGWDHKQTMSALADNKARTAANQADNEAKAMAEWRARRPPADAPPGQEPPDFKDSPVVKLQDAAIRFGFPKPHPSPAPGPGGGGGYSGGGDGGASGGTGASSNGTGGGGPLSKDLGDMINGSAAQVLASQAGQALDKGQYSQASNDAKLAMTLDPNNRQALTVSHFAEGRQDGVLTGGPSGKELKGQNDAPAGGSSGIGGGMGGSVGSLGGGSADAAGGSGLSSAGLSASAASLAAGGGASGAALSRLSGTQAAKSAQDALSMGDLGGALAFVNRALEQNPRDPALLALRSAIRARQHDYAGAERDAKAGLELAPRDSALLRDLGFAQLREKDYNAAIATANKMLELNPNDPYAYAIRAHAYGSLGDRDAMMADLKRAAELDPSFRDAADRLGGELQLPSDKDILFLFPGETSASPARTGAPAPSRGRSFSLIVGASALGGLLLALGLLATVLAPLKERVTSVFTRLTRTGPTIAGPAEATEAPASVNGHLPGLIRGQYEVSREIGSGGMGRVYAGADRALGRPVAIKKMRDELRHDAREKARFVAEAKTVAALHHPNIVDIYAIAEDGDDVFLVFEYVEGQTVHELLTRGGRLAPAEAARITRAAAEALEYAHGRGVVHRDMKPSNVMLDRAGAVKVMDFGIARMAKDTMLRQTATNTIAGTPPYMAPEQEQGRARAESDVYSLAVCAYEMLTGKLPFVGSGGGMLLNKINMSFVPPSRQTAGLPETLDGVFARAFQADPEKRYRTPREFAAALESAGSVPAKA